MPNTGHVPETHQDANPCVMKLQTEFFRTHRVSGTACLLKIAPIPVS